MAPDSSTLAWKIPWTEELVGFSPQGCKESDTADHILLTIQMHVHNITAWRRQWQPTPVFLPAESQGRGSLVGCRLWGRTESATTEATYSSSRSSREDTCFSTLLLNDSKEKQAEALSKLIQVYQGTGSSSSRLKNNVLDLQHDGP